MAVACRQGHSWITEIDSMVVGGGGGGGGGVGAGSSMLILRQIPGTALKRPNTPTQVFLLMEQQKLYPHSRRLKCIF